MRSIMAVGIGLLLALVLGLLVVQGIFAPVLTRLFGLERAGPATLPLVLLLFAAAFSFYFGGMAASYKAPAGRQWCLGRGARGHLPRRIMRGLLRRGRPWGGALCPQSEVSAPPPVVFQQGSTDMLTSEGRRPKRAEMLTSAG